MEFRARELINGLMPLCGETILRQANCFNAVQLIWSDSVERSLLGAEEFVAYIQRNFVQIPLDSVERAGDVTIVWSRSSDVLPVGAIRVDQLVKSAPGYPFGLVIEHAFTQLDDLVFQKRDPSAAGPYEIVTREQALERYSFMRGVELTVHRRKN